MNKKGKALAIIPVKHYKRTLLQSKRYRHQRNLLETLLDDEQTYTLAEVDALLENFER